MNNIHELVADYHDHLDGVSSRRMFRAIARSFAAHMGFAEDGFDAAVIEVVKKGPREAHRDMQSWRDRGLESLSYGTVACRCGFLSGLFNHLRRKGAIDWNLLPFAPKKIHTKHKRIPTREEVETLVACIDSAAEEGDAQGIRDAALVRLLYCCGLRRTEATTLRLEDIDLRTRQVRIRRRAGSPRVSVGTSVMTGRALERWLVHRGSAPGWAFYRLDRSDPSKAMAGESVRRLLTVNSVAAGLPFLVTPDALVTAGDQHSEEAVRQIRLEARDL